MYGMHGLEESGNVFHIVTQTFAVHLAFDRCTVGSLKRSSCAVEHMCAILNRPLKLVWPVQS